MNLGAQRTGNLKAHGDVLVCPARTEPVEHGAHARARHTHSTCQFNDARRRCRGRHRRIANDQAAVARRHRSRHGITPKDRGVDKDHVGFATQNIKQ